MLYAIVPRLLAAAMVAVATLSVTATSSAATYHVPPAIARDCSEDVTSSLLSWIATVPDFSTLSFGAGDCYRVEGTLQLSGREGLRFEGNGATFASFDAPADQRAVWRLVDSAGLVFRDLTIDGSYASGGSHGPGLQHAHAIDLRGTSAEIAGVTMSDVAGDCVYFGLGSAPARPRSSGTVRDSRCSRTGRNAISVTAGDDVLVQRVTTSAVGYIAFDVEPNVGPGWGARRVTFDGNTIGSYAVSAYSVVENAPISDQSFTNNRVVGRGLKITIGEASGVLYRPANVTITGNSADTAQAPSAMNLHAIDGLIVTGNSVPMTGGTMAAVDSSCDVVVSGDNDAGGAVVSSIESFACAGRSGGRPRRACLPRSRSRRPCSGRPSRREAAQRTARHVARRHARALGWARRAGRRPASGGRTPLSTTPSGRLPATRSARAAASS
jgi:hypothetical protein